MSRIKKLEHFSLCSFWLFFKFCSALHVVITPFWCLNMMIKRVSYIKPFVYNNKIDAYWLQHDLSFFIEIIHWRVQSLMKMIQRMKYSIHSTTKSTTTTKVTFCIGNQDKSDEASWFYSLIAKFHLSYIKKWHFFRSLAFTNNFWSEVGLVLAPDP